MTTREIKCPTCGAVAGKACRSVKSNKYLPDNHASRRLISINEAVRLGHVRLRKPIWSHPLDHIKIAIFDGHIGPWIKVYSPFNKECNGHDPINILVVAQEVSLDNPEFAIYDGPLPVSEEYQAAVVDHAAKVKALLARGMA